MCDNKIDVIVPPLTFYEFIKVVEYPCSSTGPQGEMILCPQCEPQRTNREANA